MRRGVDGQNTPAAELLLQDKWGSDRRGGESVRHVGGVVTLRLAKFKVANEAPEVGVYDHAMEISRILVAGRGNTIAKYEGIAKYLCETRASFFNTNVSI